MITKLIEIVYSFLWGDLIQIPLPGGSSVGISLLIILLIPMGIYFTVRTRFLPIRLFPDMVRALVGTKAKKDADGKSEKKEKKEKGSLSTFQTLIVSTATRVGMGNLVGVVAAISAGGAGAVFGMWGTALSGASTAFIEATLAQLYKEKDPLYGGYRGGPAYYMHRYMERRQKKKKRYSLIAVLFAISGLICWCGISQVISNSVTSSLENAFSVPPLYTTIVLVALAAVIVLRKNATVKVLDLLVPVMAVCYFVLTIVIIFRNIGSLPQVFERIFQEAFGFRQIAAGGFGAVLMNGIKRGLFSNEAGSGSAPCAAAAAECENPVQAGLVQALGVFIDTIVICTLTGLSIVLTGAWQVDGLEGVQVTTYAFQNGLPFPHVVSSFVLMMCLVFFAFTTILGWDYYSERCLEYLTGGNMKKVMVFRWIYILAVFIGPYMTVSAVWTIADIFNGLMALPNMIALFALNGVVVYETKKFFEAGKHKK